MSAELRLWKKTMNKPNVQDDELSGEVVRIAVNLVTPGTDGR